MRKIITSLCLALTLLVAPVAAFAQNNTSPVSGDLVRLSRQTNGSGTYGAVTVQSLFNGVGVGYSAGAGGAVTQATSRTTGVTLNAYSGAITLFTATGSAVASSFTVTDSKVAATDTIIVSTKSGTNLYEVFVTAVGAGSFQVTEFTTGGTASDAPVINFAVVHAATS